MTPNPGKETWQRAKLIVESALELEPDGREAFVHHAAGGDAALAAQVLRLLAQIDGIEDFLEGGAASAPVSVNYQGQRLGAYELGAEIGRGGMGVVHLAERVDGAYQQKVAVKLIAPDRFGGAAEARRMARERQVLARLNHPNIARLLDGGSTPDGAPYLVMEYVAGKPVDEFCQQSNLPTRGRVALVQQVCAAVQAAHQQLLIHRDIKPSNVLVTVEGTPKLLDFGIARLISPDDAAAEGDATQAAQQVFTPRFASPEQVKGESATIATDVYGLGLLLYDLLTGTSPYTRVATAPATTLALAVDVLLHDEPRLASAAARSAEGRGQSIAHELRGDLESILAKAIAKVPTDRYRNAAEFEADLGAWLAGRPVTAVRQSGWYVFKRWVARNRVATALAASAVLAMVGLTAWALMEQARARAQAAQTRQLASKLVFEYYKGVEPLPGAIPIRKRMLDDASQYLDNIVADAPRDVDVAVEAGAGFRKLADALYNGRGTANLGDKAGAIRANQRARQLLEGALAMAPNHRQANVEMGKFDIDMGSFEAENGKVEDAERLYDAGINRLKARLARDPKDGESAYEVARGYAVYASMQVKRKISALPQLAQADEALMYLKSVATDATAIGNAEMLIVSIKGNDATQRGDGEAAVRYADDRINLLHRLEKERANDNTIQSHLFTAYSGKGVILINAKRPREALAPLAEAIRRQGEFLAANPKDANQLGTMGRTYFVRARAHSDMGDREASLKDYVEAKSHFERTENVDLPPPLRRMHAQALEALGKVAKDLGQKDVLAAAWRDTATHAARYPQVYEAEPLKVWLAEARAAR